MAQSLLYNVRFVSGTRHVSVGQHLSRNFPIIYPVFYQSRSVTTLKGKTPRATPCRPTPLCLFNLGETVLELRPFRHDDLGARFFEGLGHLGLHLRSLVAADVPDDRDARPDSAQGPALAVLNGHRLLRLLAKNLAGVQVDGRVRLAGRSRERGGSAEDMVRREVLFLTHFLEGGLHASKRRRGYHCHAVFLRLGQLLQLLHDADAWFRLELELRDDLVFFAFHVLLHLGILQGEAELGLQRIHHATEVLSHKVDHQLWAGVAVVDVMFG